KLPGELVDLRLQRRDTGLKFSEFRLGLLAGGAGSVGGFGDDLLKFEPVDDGVVFEAVLLSAGQFSLAGRSSVGRASAGTSYPAGDSSSPARRGCRSREPSGACRPMNTRRAPCRRTRFSRSCHPW